MIIIILFIIVVLLSPAVILLVIGLSKSNSNPERAKLFYILAAVYVLIGGGICASLVM